MTLDGGVAPDDGGIVEGLTSAADAAADVDGEFTKTKEMRILSGLALPIIIQMVSESGESRRFFFPGVSRWHAKLVCALASQCTSARDRCFACHARRHWGDGESKHE